MEEGWGAITAAIIGIIGILIQLFISIKISNKNDINTNQQNYKQNEFIEKQNLDNMNFQERIESSKIAADLKAKARIEWIQEVRKLTSNFITNLSQYIQSSNIRWSEIETDKNLLILNFGPDSNKTLTEIGTLIYFDSEKIHVDDVAKEILLKKEDNKQKNNYIIKYLEVLHSFYQDPIRNQKLTEVSKKNAEINLIYSMGEFEWDYEIVEGIQQSYISNILLDEKLQKQVSKLESEIETLKYISENYIRDLALLNEIMRIYFKVEWDIAKAGK